METVDLPAIVKGAGQLVASAKGLGILKPGSPEEQAVMALLGKLKRAANPNMPEVVAEQASEVAVEAAIIRRAVVSKILEEGIPEADPSPEGRAHLRAFQTWVQAWKTSSERMFAAMRLLGVDLAEGEDDELQQILVQISRKKA